MSGVVDARRDVKFETHHIRKRAARLGRAREWVRKTVTEKIQGSNEGVEKPGLVGRLCLLTNPSNQLCRALNCLHV